MQPESPSAVETAASGPSSVPPRGPTSAQDVPRGRSPEPWWRSRTFVQFFKGGLGSDGDETVIPAKKG